jgi:hypothetical protein
VYWENSLYFENSFKKKKKRETANKNSQAVLKTSQETKSNLNPLHKLFFISRETGRLSAKVQQIPKGPLLSKCAQSSVCRTAEETPGPSTLHGFTFHCREGHVSMPYRDLQPESLAKFGKKRSPLRAQEPSSSLEHFHSGSSLTRVQLKLNTHTLNQIM